MDKRIEKIIIESKRIEIIKNKLLKDENEFFKYVISIFEFIDKNFAEKITIDYIKSTSLRLNFRDYAYDNKLIDNIMSLFCFSVYDVYIHSDSKIEFTFGWDENTIELLTEETKEAKE